MDFCNECDVWKRWRIVTLSIIFKFSFYVDCLGSNTHTYAQAHIHEHSVVHVFHASLKVTGIKLSFHTGVSWSPSSIRPRRQAFGSAAVTMKSKLRQTPDISYHTNTTHNLHKQINWFLRNNGASTQMWGRGKQAAAISCKSSDKFLNVQFTWLL